MSQAKTARIEPNLNRECLVIPGESQEEFNALYADLVAHYRPSGEMETELVFEIASSRWQLRRMQQMESDFYVKAIRLKLEALGEAATVEEARAEVFYELAMNPKPLNFFHRQASRLRRSYEKALKELQQIQKERGEVENAENGVQNEPQLTQAMLHFLTSPPILPSRSQAVYREEMSETHLGADTLEGEIWRSAA